MYCRLLLKLILRDKAVWISTLVLAAAFSVPIAFNSPIYGPFFMKQGMQGFVDAFNTRAPQASGTDLSPEQQNDAELARYANAALAAQTDAAFLDSAESYYALMGEGFQSGSIVGDQETNDAALAYCRALRSSGITDIPASANDLPFLSFLPYAIATAPSFLPFIPFLLSSILVLGATRPGPLAAKAPVPKFRRLIQTVFSKIAAGTAMLLAGLAPGGIYALALNGFGQIGYPIAFFHDGALTTTTAGNVFTALLLALLAGGTLISVCSAVLSTATRRVLAGPLTSALLVAAPAFPLLSDSALGHNAALNLLPLPVFSPIEATGYVGCFPTEFIGSGSSGASMLAVALAYVAVLFAVGAVATRSPKQPGPAKKHHGLELLDASVGYGSTTILSIGSLFLSPGTAVKVYSKQQIGVEVEKSRQVALHIVLIEYQLVSLAIVELHLCVFEVEKRGGIGAVEHGPLQLNLQITFYAVVGILLHSEENAADNPLVWGKSGIGPFAGIDILVHGLLKGLKHRLIGALNLTRIHFYCT